jgi:hypothetical protein
LPVISMSFRRHTAWIGAAACAVLIIIGITGCASGGEAGPASPPTVASAFSDAAFAEIATDGRSAMWLALAGFNRRQDFGVRVFRSTGGNWTDAGSPGSEASDKAPVSIALAPGSARPCLGFTETRTRRPVVSCLTAAGWRSESLPLELRSARLLQLKNHGGDLVGLFAISESEHAERLRLYRGGARAWMPVGPAVSVPPATLAQLASTSGPDQGITLGLEIQSRDASRYMVSLEDGHWKRQGMPLRDDGMGPLVGGPALDGNTALFPVNNAESTPWTFTAAPVPDAPSDRLRQSHPLSVAGGNAQGRIDALPSGPWASWQEDKPLPNGNFRVSIYAARLDERGAPLRKVSLWHGVSVGPGSTQVVEFRGEPVALFMPARSDRDQSLTVEADRLL